MIFPSSTTRDCKRARRMVKTYSRADKVRGRRVYRRILERATRLIQVDPMRFYSEPFNVKRYTGWDIA